MKKNSLPEKLFAKKLGHDKNALGSSLCQRNTVSKEASEPATKSKSKLRQPFSQKPSSFYIFSIAFFIQQI